MIGTFCLFLMVSQNTSQVQGGGLSASTQDMNKEQCGSKQTTVAPDALFSTQSMRETTPVDSLSQKATNTAQNWASKLGKSSPGRRKW